jgi:hypothetical protein
MPVTGITYQQPKLRQGSIGKRAWGVAYGKPKQAAKGLTHFGISLTEALRPF